MYISLKTTEAAPQWSGCHTAREALRRPLSTNEGNRQMLPWRRSANTAAQIATPKSSPLPSVHFLELIQNALSRHCYTVIASGLPAHFLTWSNQRWHLPRGASRKKWKPTTRENLFSIRVFIYLGGFAKSHLFSALLEQRETLLASRHPDVCVELVLPVDDPLHLCRRRTYLII